MVYQRTRPEASSHDLLVAITTDHMFRIPAIRLAEARQGAAATYVSVQLAKSCLRWRASSHPSLEIPFAFDNLDQAGVDFFFGARAIASRTGGYHAQSLV